MRLTHIPPSLVIATIVLAVVVLGSLLGTLAHGEEPKQPARTSANIVVGKDVLPAVSGCRIVNGRKVCTTRRWRRRQ